MAIVQATIPIIIKKCLHAYNGIWMPGKVQGVYKTVKIFLPRLAFLPGINDPYILRLEWPGEITPAQQHYSSRRQSSHCEVKFKFTKREHNNFQVISINNLNI